MLAKVGQQDGDEEVQHQELPDYQQQHEVEGRPGPTNLHAVVHYGVPVLPGEHLKHGDERPEEGVEVVPGDLAVVQTAHLAAEHLHAQQREDEHSQDNHERKFSEADQGEVDGVEEVLQLLPRTHQLQNPKNPERPERRQRTRVCHRQLHDGHEHHECVEDVEVVLDVLLGSESKHLENHLHHERNRKHQVDHSQSILVVLRHPVVLHRQREGVDQDQYHEQRIKPPRVDYLPEESPDSTRKRRVLCLSTLLLLQRKPGFLSQPL